MQPQIFEPSAPPCIPFGDVLCNPYDWFDSLCSGEGLLFCPSALLPFCCFLLLLLLPAPFLYPVSFYSRAGRLAAAAWPIIRFQAPRTYSEGEDQDAKRGSLPWHATDTGPQLLTTLSEPRRWFCTCHGIFTCSLLEKSSIGTARSVCARQLACPGRVCSQQTTRLAKGWLQKRWRAPSGWTARMLLGVVFAGLSGWRVFRFKRYV